MKRAQLPSRTRRGLKSYIFQLRRQRCNGSAVVRRRVLPAAGGSWTHGKVFGSANLTEPWGYFEGFSVRDFLPGVQLKE